MLKIEAFVRPRSKQRVPLMYKTLALGLLVSYLPGFVPSGLGISISVLGWMIPFLGAVIVVFIRHTRIRFPMRIWLLWMAWVVSYVPFSTADNALQRSIMLLVPVVVGMAFSTIWVTDELICKTRRWINIFTIIYLLAAGMSNGLLTQGELYDATGFAAGAITATLLGCWYVALYWAGITWMQWVWLVLALVPVAANTRTAMLAMAVTLPLTLTPISNRKRVIALALIMACGVLIFHTERVQRKMFFSGQGTLLDALDGVVNNFSGKEDNSGDFVTTGRKAMNMVLTDGLNDAYWFGHGANTTEAIAQEIAGVPHPHNDWLRLRYEYGLLGMLLFLGTVLAQAWHAWRGGQLLPRDNAVFLYVGSSAFVPMLLLMSSDNVILYAAWFGNLQFAMLGLGYARSPRFHIPIKQA